MLDITLKIVFSCQETTFIYKFSYENFYSKKKKIFYQKNITQGESFKMSDLKRLDIELRIRNPKTDFCRLIYKNISFRHILCFLKICIKIILFWLFNLQEKWVRFIEKVSFIMETEKNLDCHSIPHAWKRST